VTGRRLHPILVAAGGIALLGTEAVRLLGDLAARRRETTVAS